MSAPRLLRPADYRRMLWKNGGGITTEIARGPTEGADFDWRVSIAEIAQDGDFSVFPGVDRTLMLLDGGGVELEFAEDGPVQLTQRYARHVFPGEAPVYCRLLDGPTRDFNLMLRRGAMRGDVYARPLVGPMVFFREPGTQWLIHLVGGSAQFQDAPELGALNPGDTLIFDADDARAQRVLLGHGEAVMVRLRRGDAE